MPLPPEISSRRSGRRRRQDEVAVGGGEADDHADPRVLGQVARDEAVGVGLDGQLDLARVEGRARGGVAARAPHAVDLDRELDELARLESARRRRSA